MRRNTARLLKYLVVAAIFLTVGPVMVKVLFGQQHEKESGAMVQLDAAAAHGMPVDPDEMKAAVHNNLVRNGLLTVYFN